MKFWLPSTSALIACAGLLSPSFTIAAHADAPPLVTAQPDPTPDVAPFFVDRADPRWRDYESDDKLIQQLRDKIKYVFVIFNENRSFDHQYGTFPGANGLYSDGLKPRAAADTPGFTQTYKDVTGATATVQPFRVGPEQNSSFKDSTDHSHKGLAVKLDVVDGVAKMDKFGQVEYDRYAKAGTTDTAIGSQKEGAQFAQLAMAHVDCDTIPFFWRYASRFTLFDNIFATEDTPSTPNAVAMLAGQGGESQWVQHPAPEGADPTKTGATAPISGTIEGKTYSGTATTQGPPLVNDPQPWWGSEFDGTTTRREPSAPKESWDPRNIASNLTFASVPLTAMGNSAKAITQQDKNSAFDLSDVANDIDFIQNNASHSTTWRWYENGYDLEPNDAGGIATHTNYVSHHSAPQYFGYLANNPDEQTNIRGEGDFFSDMAKGDLPKDGGVFYIRGGYYNLDYPKRGAVITNPNYPNAAGLTAGEIAAINVAKSGDDDHPGYSDSQLSEAMAARVINAVSRNPEVWAHSAIIITYDESDGLYDHVPPTILSYGPDKLPLARGIRVPLILISPYARTHVVSHAMGDHNAVIETVNAIFGLPPLSQLPDEAAALKKGDSDYFNQFAPAGFRQTHLGPRDTWSPETQSLLSGFDPARLSGDLPLLPASLADIADDVVNSFPHYGARGCDAIGVKPEDVRQGIVNKIPSGFNAFPSTLPAYN